MGLLQDAAEEYNKKRPKPPQWVEDKVRLGKNETAFVNKTMPGIVPVANMTKASTTLDKDLFEKSAREELRDIGRISLPGVMETYDYLNPKVKGADPLKKMSDNIKPKTPTIEQGGFGKGGTGSTSMNENYGSIYGQQQGLADILKQRAMGTTPSIAANAAKEAQDRNIQQTMALAMSQPSSALGRRAAMQNQAMSNQKIGQDLINARLAEMNQAQAAYGNVLGGMSGTQTQRDISEMNDLARRDLAQAQMDWQRDIIDKNINRQMYGAAFDAAGNIISTGLDWASQGANTAQQVGNALPDTTTPVNQGDIYQPYPYPNPLPEPVYGPEPQYGPINEPQYGPINDTQGYEPYYPDPAQTNPGGFTGYNLTGQSPLTRLTNENLRRYPAQYYR